jgi:hypothetical protein
MAGRFRKFRQRFGITAPRVAVHTAVPWYWRWLGVVVVFAVSGALAAWMYDEGRRFAGFDRSEAEGELTALKRELDEIRAERDRLRAVANASDNRLAIERTAQERLAEQIRGIEQENARLREELEIFESMPSSDARKGQALSIYRFKVEPEVLPGEYRYRLLLLTSAGRREREFRGRLELVVSLTEGGRSVMMTFPEPTDAEASAFRLAFKYYQRVEGTFRVGPKAKVQSVQVRVYENGSGEEKATSTVTLG